MSWFSKLRENVTLALGNNNKQQPTKFRAGQMVVVAFSSGFHNFSGDLSQVFPTYLTSLTTALKVIINPNINEVEYQ